MKDDSHKHFEEYKKKQEEDKYYDRSNFNRFKEEMSEKDFLIWNDKSIEVVEQRDRREWLIEHHDVLCNNCGKSLLVFWASKKPEIYGIHRQRITGGYCSTGGIEDTITYYFNLCENCISKMFDNFEIPVLTGEYDLWDGHEIRLTEKEITDKLGDKK
jgi:hypothetical protein